MTTYGLSSEFHKLLFNNDQGVEPLLVVDADPDGKPKRMFLVRYVIGEGGGEGGRHPIFKNELTGYDYAARTTYPTQSIDLEKLQITLEPFLYASPEAQYSKIIAENTDSTEKRPIKAIVSRKLTESLVAIYGYGW